MPTVSPVTTNATSYSSDTSDTTSQDTVSGPGQTLSQNDFLQLLVSQMENQDPLDPQSDTEMAAQMAQFTSLQQSSSMAGSLSMMQANSLVGSTVGIQVNSQTTTSGVVTGVIENNGTAQVVVDGANYNLSQITSVQPPTASATGTTPASTTPTTTTP
jgi:flagellar basal-body rod modification protein FlgD